MERRQGDDRRPRVAQRHDALVLAGGAGRRLGGQDKGALRIGGLSLLDRVLLACADAERAVVVGPPRPTARPVRWIQEAPPGGGPVAAIAAGLPLTRAPLLLVLATDMPFLDSGTLGRLISAAWQRDGAVLVDVHGRVQPLAAVYRRSALARALAELGPPAGQSVRRLLAGLDLAHEPDPGQVAFDCDTWADLGQARARAGDGQAERTGAVLEDWVAAVAAELGVEPDVDVRALLAVARVAAHQVDRPAAPLTTFLIGLAAAREGGSRAAVERAAGQVTALAESWAREHAVPARPSDKPSEGSGAAGAGG